ncbi:uncharacterized protein JCM15063_000552 [Sporobolomyces koalae]|uniref:uncharacterized protein n=1 Tax=Sporobolomyces koalae TaxID=500713 RepID=UPI0031789195
MSDSNRAAEGSGTAQNGSTTASTNTPALPPPIRGRPRSTSVSSGSPNPLPGVPLPTLFPEPTPAPPQLSTPPQANPFAFSFPSSSPTASTSLASNLGPAWSKSSTGAAPEPRSGGGHRSSLSIPGIVSPSPLLPGAVPKGGRHRRTQSVSPPGFPTMSPDAVNGFASGLDNGRRSSEPNVPGAKAEGSASPAITTVASSRQPRLSISTSNGNRLGLQQQPSPTRSPRQKSLHAMSSSPTNLSLSDPHHPSSHASSHLPSHSHGLHLAHHHHHQTPPLSSHAALLQGIRSHALPHSPTLEASSTSHHDVSPLSTSPSMSGSHLNGFVARRLSGGQHSSTRPNLIPSPLTGSRQTASPPFGPSSPSNAGHLSPKPFHLAPSHSVDLSSSDALRHVALDQAMTEAVSDHYSTSPVQQQGLHPRTRRSSSGAIGTSYSPPLLPLPFDLPCPASPGPTGGRSRSGSIGRAISPSTSPASLFLDDDQREFGSPSENEPQMGTSPRDSVLLDHDIARPPTPPLGVNSLFPVSGTLPIPSPPAPLSSLGFDIPSPIVSSPPQESSDAAPSTSSPPFGSILLSPTLSNLSTSRPPSTGLLSLAPIQSDSENSVPPASPHRTPLSLPPPLNAPTPLPPHLVGNGSLRARSRSRSRERDKSRSRSRSHSPKDGRDHADSDKEVDGHHDRPRSPGGMRLTGLEFVPKVHSPLVSPPATDESEFEMTGPEVMDDEHEPEQDEIVANGGSSDSSEDEKKPSPPSMLPPPIPPPHIDPTISSALGLPYLSIPNATSPIGTPEHLEESPTSIDSYFALAPGAALVRSPASLSGHTITLPPATDSSNDRGSNWEDELDEDDYDSINTGHHEHDETGELGTATQRTTDVTATRPDKVNLLQMLGITKTDAEREAEREFAERESERRRLEHEAQERDREERMRQEELLRQQQRRDEQEQEYGGSSGFMEIDLENQGEYLVDSTTMDESHDYGFGEAGDLSVGDVVDVEGESLTIDEESLSALERIFVCAKSEAVEERARVAHFLADWLPAVEIYEAVEYILPLLAILTDDEMVKEVFAPQLDRVMWHFFAHCPLTELDSHSDKEPSNPGSPVPSRYLSRPDLEVEQSPALSIDGPSDRSATPPPTSETSPAASSSKSDPSYPNLPRISVTTFTAILGALLTDQSTTVAKAAEAAVVRFLCRLRDKPIPPASPTSYTPLELDPLFHESAPVPELTVSEPNSDAKSSYTMSAEVRQLLEDEIVTGIVIGLARLDEDSHEQPNGESSSTELTKPHGTDSKETEPETSNLTLYMSPEENALEWVEEEAASQDPEPRMEWDQEHDTADIATSALAIPATGSPADQVFSSFSPEQPADEESSIGKMVSMSLIGAIAAAHCLDPDVLTAHFVPELERMKEESMVYVRKEAVQALGSLAAAVPLEQLEKILMPLHDVFCQDPLWHVRRAAVLALPAVCKPLPRDSLHKKAVEAIRRFSTDESRNVRSGALEIAGELIYLFHEDPAGVPDELLSFFLGKSLDTPGPGDVSSTSEDDSLSFGNTSSHFRNALESPTGSLLDTSSSWQLPNHFNHHNTLDADRPILTAFNFPAVILTLGRERWHRVREHHRALCRGPVEKARQSLASSLHEVAKIIGPEQSDACLLEPFSGFLQDVEIVQTAILENLPTLLSCFGVECARKALETLGEAWTDITNWRLREHTLKRVAEFGPQFMQNDGEEHIFLILAKAYKDSVASVREQASVTVPPLLNAVLDAPAARAKLFAFLAVFRTDSSYRNRLAYVSTVVACVKANLPRAHFEQYFLDTLVDLARDKVVSVRIAVARAVSEACQRPALYSDPDTRTAIREILSVLVDCPDRDVRLAVLEYYQPSPGASPSPHSRQPSPEATRPNRTAYGVRGDDSPRKSLGSSSSPTSPTGDDSTMTEHEGDGDDVDMGDHEQTSESHSGSGNNDSDGVLLESPTNDEDVVTRDEGDFVEISKP